MNLKEKYSNIAGSATTELNVDAVWLSMSDEEEARIKHTIRIVNSYVQEICFLSKSFNNYKGTKYNAREHKDAVEYIIDYSLKYFELITVQQINDLIYLAMSCEKIWPNNTKKHYEVIYNHYCKLILN